MLNAWSAMGRFYNRRRRPRPWFMRHRLFTTTRHTEDPLTLPPAPAETALLAELSAAFTPECRFDPSPARKTRYLEWAAALLLHAAVIALALISFIPNPAQQQASQQGVSVVFENGGTQSTTAPPSPLKTMATQAETPPPPAPPPPNPQDLEPEVNLNLPTAPFAEMPQPEQAPQPEPQPQPKREVQRVERHREPRYPQYQVMNNMSLNNGSAPQPSPSFTGKPGLNLNLSQSDLNSMIAPQIQVEGDIGQDWMDGFNKWVNDHIYYPQAAVENNQQGTSVIQFTVHRDGSVTGVRLLSSAGSTFLDQAWLGIFLHNNVPAFPPGTKADTIKITASLQYQLIP
jgi:protein TonB